MVMPEEAKVKAAMWFYVLGFVILYFSGWNFSNFRHK
jgi:hypothetical protein